jgi:putative cardiolipin synthase
VATSALGQLLAPALDAHPGETGMVPLDTGRESLVARIALCDLAERSIDVQTFDWGGDTVGRVVWDHLRRAADRGVRVRILVDDVHLGGRHVRMLTHKNIEVRSVNPFGRREGGRVLELLHRFGRLDHRMHNKLFIVDNQVAFVGGRNLADEYFGVSERFNYRDLDVLAIGPAVAQTEEAFDAYWGSPLAIPNTLLGRSTPEERARALATLEEKIVEARRSCPYPLALRRDETLARLDALLPRMSWGVARVVWDDPARLAGTGRLPPGGPNLALEQLLRDAQREIVAEAAYFVPDPSLARVAPVLQRGVLVRILTNSLPSTDLVPVHAHYAATRLPLLSLGAELYELRPDAAMRALHVADQARPARLGLHAKVTIFDRRTVFIGSFNLDPRSRALNTEVVLIAESPALAEQILAQIDRDLAPENSWSLAIGDHGGLIWQGAGAPEHHDGFQPGGAWRQFQDVVFSLLPVREQL